MNRPVCIFCFVIMLQAMPSWGYESSVIVDGKEMLQPAAFRGYHYDQISAVCPGGVCSGSLVGSTIDLTGYIWGSGDEVIRIFSAYEASGGQNSQGDFAPTSGLGLVGGMVRDPPSAEDRIYLVLAGGVEIFDISRGGTSYGAWFWRPREDFIVSLEEPVKAEVHSGIGNLRGWAIAEEGINRVEIYIDGKYMYDAPYGGERTDVAEAYPNIEGSGQSGFSLAFGYSNLSIGENTITARAFDTLGEHVESSATFEVVAFHKNFISKGDIVDASQANMSASGDEILLDNVSVDGELYELRLKWRTAEQGFEIIEIR